MNKIFFIIIVLALLIALWFLFPQKTDDPEFSEAIKPAKIERYEPTEETTPQTLIDIDQVDISEMDNTQTPAIALNDSDTLVKDFLSNAGATSILENLRDEVLRRFVMATYAISQGSIPKQTPFISTTIPPFQATPLFPDKKTYKPNKANASRLTPLINQITKIPPEKFAHLYLENQSLFQQAFDELGTDKLFDKKLTKALDIIIEAPLPPDQPTLVRQTVTYQYQRAKYENTPPIIKALWRLGKENQLKIQKYCDVLKDELKNR
ncbi:MAG: DUF3014 domain-containing protein [Cellvibrionales bacterium]|nr:DUF3014 domain-containing protein [Cellvibrionales bacterium]